jgi:hypothetical protein
MTARSSAIVFAARTLRMNCFTTVCNKGDNRQPSGSRNTKNAMSRAVSQELILGQSKSSTRRLGHLAGCYLRNRRGGRRQKQW